MSPERLPSTLKPLQLPRQMLPDKDSQVLRAGNAQRKTFAGSQMIKPMANPQISREAIRPRELTMNAA